MDSFRVGRKTPEKPRPIKVELEHPTDALVLLKKASKLKSTDLMSVYLSPDRNKQEQAAHSKLVAKRRTMIKEDPNKFYFIRNNKVNFIDKNSTASGRCYYLPRPLEVVFLCFKSYTTCLLGRGTFQGLVMYILGLGFDL